MDGLLLIDKPAGPTSHDVVARLRRSSGERHIGHTGTLDPRATGLMALVCGRATRLASRLTATTKAYEAAIRLGVATDTDDAAGTPLGTPVADLPGDAAVHEALETFRGALEQLPPAHSAKKIGGEKAYDLARRAQPVALAPVPVTVHAIEWLGRDGDLIHLRLTASSGFYVRALARDLGARLGCGAHLFALRRTAVGAFDLAQAIALEEAEGLGRDIVGRVIPPAEMLPAAPAVRLTEPGVRRALHGNALSPEYLESRWLPSPGDGDVRLIAPDGRLIAVAASRGGALHPVVVLG